MSKPRLFYFDAPVSRGEECRILMHLAGIDFEDVRLNPQQWLEMKPTTPYGSVPVLEMPGQAPIAHSNAIMVLIGRMHGLHPSDPFEAARAEGMLEHVEDLRHAVGPSMRMSEPAKKEAREALVATTLPAWGAAAERNILGEPFFSGATIGAVDVKLHMAVRWFINGKVDHVPATIFAAFPKLMRVYEAVRDHAGVKSWYART